MTSLHRLSLVNLGITTIITQLIVVREFLAVFQGNELIIGLILGCWMLLTGFGAWLASFHTPTLPLTHSHTHFPYIVLLQLLTGILPLLTSLAISLSRALFFPSGVMTDPFSSLLVIFLTLLPFCLVSGMLFPMLARDLSESFNKNLIHKAYSFESAGSMVGGLLFSLVLILFLKTYQCLLILLVLNSILAFAISFTSGYKKTAFFILGIFIAVSSLLLVIDPERITASFIYKGQKILEIKDTPYGKLVVTRMEDQMNFYENGVPFISGNDPVTREEAVHYAMLLHPGPESVLLISGGTGGTLDEILKYPVSKVDYVEINPWLIHMVDEYLPLNNDARIRVINRDALRFLSTGSSAYDVIILNTPEPFSAEMNRYFTVDFFRTLKEKLNPGGLVSLSLPASVNYLSEEAGRLHSVTYMSLAQIFQNIRIIPGGKDYFLASEENLEKSLNKIILEKKIDNLYVNQYYLDDEQIMKRSDVIMQNIQHDVPVNSDLKPYAYFLYLRYWMSHFRTQTWIIPSLLVIILILFFIFLSPVNIGLFTGGFSSSSLVFLLLLWFQVIFGNIYQMTGVIFALFMAGLVAGSWYRPKLIKEANLRSFLFILSIMAVTAAVIAAVLLIPHLSTAFSWLLMIIILIFTFVTGTIMGLQFAIANSIRSESILKASGQSYSADLIGSAIGVILVSIYVIPLIGLVQTSLVITGINLMTVLIISLKTVMAKS